MRRARIIIVIARTRIALASMTRVVRSTLVALGDAIEDALAATASIA